MVLSDWKVIADSCAIVRISWNLIWELGGESYQPGRFLRVTNSLKLWEWFHRSIEEDKLPSYEEINAH